MAGRGGRTGGASGRQGRAALRPLLHGDSLFPVEVPAVRIAGVDEAGRGSLAGPVVAAAVILPADAVIPGLADSKLLRPRTRERLAEVIGAACVAWSVAAVEAAEIDATNILRATLAAMARAVEGLASQPALVLVDGNVTPRLSMPVRAIVQGDRRVAAISAASILAKVTRDRLMEAWSRQFPRYGFAQHKGYGTALHRANIARYGPTPIHRRTFAGVREHVRLPVQGSLW
ncbi:MAG: ribonuclease HII [candidate division NC10 bacterium]|nr:ribonuclease HII [candidate division NC10 bacterium]